ncbi:MAG: cation transporter [Chlamydiae bacterium SM23_39]|nr:MAG: cation transporter [Chlamydiae bacterium SM23_39]
MHILKDSHSKSIKEIMESLKTSEKGLSTMEAKKREKIFGPNIFKEKKISYINIFFRQFANILVYILLVASLIALFSGKWVDCIVIFSLILINSFIGFWQEVKAEVSIKSLEKLTESKMYVVRDGEGVFLPSSEIVPGDIVILEEGSAISADLRLSSGNNLCVDESLLTGESIPIEKDHRVVLKKNTSIFFQKNMVFSGTHVIRGSGEAIVVNTGKNTYLATIVEKAKEPAPDSPLSQAIKFFAKYYSAFLIILFILVGAYGYFQKRDIVDVSYILIAELVSAVPEGLPIVVTVVMVIGAIALSKKKTLVRQLFSVETLGSATVVASDKTGTITEGKLKVKKVFFIDKDRLELTAHLCIESKKDPIDQALWQWKKSEDIFLKKYPKIWGLAFDPKTRLMATAHILDGNKKVFVKGAFEELKKLAGNQKDFFQLEKNMEEMSLEGLRVIAFGVGDFKDQKIERGSIDIVGIIGFLDPPKESVKSAVFNAKKAKIRVIMITGDHPLTAKTVAKEVGIYKEGDKVLTGEQIDKLSDQDLFFELKKTTVLARILPEHKYRIVKNFQQNKEIVVVSGDGVNDVPALKIADLSIAMGGGTEAAKSVSKMIITDNNLKVIISAIKNGRVIADNIRKVIYYLLSSSLQEIVFISLAIFSGFPLPLTPIQILWINIVTDGVQDKAFPFAKGEGDVMKRFPRKPRKQFFDLNQIYRVGFYGLIMGFISFEFFRYLLKIYSYEMSVTIIFSSMAVSQWLNGIQSQKEKEPFFKNIKKSITINPYIFFSISIGIVLQLFAVYLGGKWFYTHHMSLADWKYPLIVSIITFFVVEIRKWIEVLFKKGKKKWMI